MARCLLRQGAMRRWLLLLCLPAGCGSGGALGQLEVTPECAPADFVCATSGLDAPVAAGATLPLDIRLDVQGASAPPLRLMGADPDVFEAGGAQIRAREEGTAALLVFDREEDVVLDFIHVSVWEPDRLVLHKLSEEGHDFGDAIERLELLVGDEIYLTARPYAGTQPLLGGAGASWRSEPSGPVTLLRDGIPHRVRLVAREPGEAKVSVESLGLEADVTVEVLP